MASMEEGPPIGRGDENQSDESETRHDDLGQEPAPNRGDDCLSAYKRLVEQRHRIPALDPNDEEDFWLGDNHP